MSGVDSPFDPGLQAERTALSWQRTTLAFSIGSLVVARLLVDYLGSLSFLIAASGLVIAAGLFLMGHRRYRSAHTILVGSSGKRVALPSAMPLLALALALAFVVFGLATFGLVLAVIIEVSR